MKSAQSVLNNLIQNKPKIIFIIGPTAAGKSGLAVELAKKINGEIVSCDSMAVYKGMDIISSKPSKALQRQIPHHLIDIMPPSKEYNAAKFVRDAERAIKAILKKKKTPLVCGGSGLYVDSLFYGVFKEPKGDKKLRAKLEKEAKKFGNAHLYARLKELDKDAAEKIHPNNLRRIIRALEVCLISKDKFSRIKQNRHGLLDKYDARIFAVNLSRDKLYARIEARVDKMFAQGLVKEVKGLLKKKLSRTARQALGIKEVEGYLKEEYDLEKAKYLLKRNSRHFAKRQLTWFRRNKYIHWLDAAENFNKLACKMATQAGR